MLPVVLIYEIIYMASEDEVPNHPLKPGNVTVDVHYFIRNSCSKPEWLECSGALCDAVSKNSKSN